MINVSIHFHSFPSVFFHFHQLSSILSTFSIFIHSFSCLYLIIFNPALSTTTKIQIVNLPYYFHIAHQFLFCLPIFCCRTQLFGLRIQIFGTGHIKYDIFDLDLTCLTSIMLVNFCLLFAFSANTLLQDSNIWLQVSNIWDRPCQI